jgi:hypothetical protein
VAAWFVRRHSEPGTQPADVASVDTEPAAATTVDTRAALLDRIEGLAAKQDEISRHADRAAATADQLLMTRPAPAPVQVVAQLAAWTTGLLSFDDRGAGRAANRVTLCHDGLRRAC